MSWVVSYPTNIFDHAKSAKELNMMQIPIIATKGTREAIGLARNTEYELVPEETTINIGNFVVTAYKANHDAAEPCMFLIYHPNIGNLLFATDTYLINYDFRGCDHYLIEANYSEKILQERVEEGQLNIRLAQRIMKSHLSLERAIKQVRGSETVKNIILVHLSDSNSNAEEFKQEVQKSTGKPVYIADKGLKVTLSKWR